MPDRGDRLTILVGDALERLQALPDESLHCCLTSPPYWGLRDYGMDGQIGLERTPEEWCNRLVEVFREVRRVLRRDGTLWLNIGDAYAGGGRGPCGPKQATNAGSTTALPTTGILGYKPKDLIGLPWMLALALRADGWYLRSDIIWAKPNPMPESVTDRPTSAHEYLFLLAKAGRYYYDAEAVKEPATEPRRCGRNSHANVDRDPAHGTSKQDAVGSRRYADFNARCDFANPSPTRNLRDVWTIPTHPYPEAHFATFPPELVRPCILAGTSERGVCPECGAPWQRILAREKNSRRRSPEVDRTLEAMRTGRTDGKTDGPDGRVDDICTVGWSPCCCCGHEETVPASVLDPFLGSGTTALVALELGRRAVGIELNPEYAEMARKRCAPALAQLRLAI